MTPQPDPTKNALSLPAEGLRLQLSQGRIQLQLRALAVGRELCLILDGGDRPHLGAVALAAVGEESRTVQRPDHREAELAQELAELAAKRLQRPVAVVCGIHLDAITPEEIDAVLTLSRQLTADLLQRLAADLPKEPTS